MDRPQTAPAQLEGNRVTCAIDNPGAEGEPGPIGGPLRTHLDDLIEERDQARAEATRLEGENRALRKIALVWLEDVALLPGESLNERLEHLIRTASE